jgi:AraC-like DNA-binding protein
MQRYRNSFWYETTNLEMFKNNSHSIEGGFVWLCTSGEAVVLTGAQQYRIVKNTSAMFLSGMKFFLLSTSGDFNVRVFSFSKKLYEEVVLKLPPSFSQYINEESVYEHPVHSATLKKVRVLMDTAALICEERTNKFADSMQRNFLQIYMLYLLENVQPFLNQETSKYTGRQRLFHRFVSLLYNHCMQHRDVDFYAGKLCITPRYLYDVTIECSPGLTPKQLIDKQLLLEIKTLLYSSDFTITEIAFQLNLPDQSYLCRYFKRQTGISPTEYRKKLKNILQQEINIEKAIMN